MSDGGRVPRTAEVLVVTGGGVRGRGVPGGGPGEPAVASYFGRRRQHRRFSLPNLSRVRHVVDARGAFVALGSAAVLVASFLPWLALTPLAGATAGAAPLLATILDPGYGGWRGFLPVAAAVGVVVGVVDAMMRSTDRGALFVFLVVRLQAVAQLGLVVATLAAKMPGPGAPVQGAVAVSLRWPAWGALAAAVVALGASAASASERP